eukprot:TRINITY_DN4253_c0_g2_i1.p1 TRINITY_DN4253_c0_g2~~TRINITY_DN4253_c0_g2_i1.p1  ORF type:complete len:363 (+),score=82.78 TRINITY_DN4253_c0_g2_i1:668-1756(+)
MQQTFNLTVQKMRKSATKRPYSQKYGLSHILADFDGSSDEADSDFDVNQAAVLYPSDSCSDSFSDREEEFVKREWQKTPKKAPRKERKRSKAHRLSKSPERKKKIAAPRSKCGRRKKRKIAYSSYSSESSSDSSDSLSDGGTRRKYARKYPQKRSKNRRSNDKSYEHFEDEETMRKATDLNYFSSSVFRNVLFDSEDNSDGDNILAKGRRQSDSEDEAKAADKIQSNAKHRAKAAKSRYQKILARKRSEQKAALKKQSKYLGETVLSIEDVLGSWSSQKTPEIIQLKHDNNSGASSEEQDDPEKSEEDNSDESEEDSPESADDKTPKSKQPVSAKKKIVIKKKTPSRKTPAKKRLVIRKRKS